MTGRQSRRDLKRQLAYHRTESRRQDGVIDELRKQTRGLRDALTRERTKAKNLRAAYAQLHQLAVDRDAEWRAADPETHGLVGWERSLANRERDLNRRESMLLAREAELDHLAASRHLPDPADHSPNHSGSSPKAQARRAGAS